MYCIILYHMLYHYRSYQKSSKYQESVKLTAADTSFPKLCNFHLQANFISGNKN